MRRSAHVEAVLLILGTGFCFATLDTLSKLSADFAPVTQTLWLRYLAQFLFTLIWWWFRVRPVLGAAFFRTQHPRFHVLRGVLLAASTALCFIGLRYMPVGELTAVSFTSPIVAMLLASWLMHEGVSRAQWWLAALGFLGAMIVIRPGSGLFGWAVLFPIGLALVNGSFLTLTRRLASGRENPILGQLAAGLVGTLIFSVPLLWPGSFKFDLLAWQWLVMLGIGVTATLGHFFLLQAFARDTPAALAPFTYAQIAFAMVGGWIAFAHVPDGWAMVGILVIAATGVLSAWIRHRRWFGQS